MEEGGGRLERIETESRRVMERRGHTEEECGGN